MCHSVGVSRTTPAGVVARLAARSMLNASVSTTATAASGEIRRSAARSLARSSPMANGFVT